jgi:hypothetical protein
VDWEETRGASRVVVAGARNLAHADDAKSRADEASRLPVRSIRPRVLAGAGAAVVVLALIAFLAFRGDADKADPAALAKVQATPSATPSAPTPADVLTEAAPTGVYKVVIVGRTTTTRGGQTKPLKERDDPLTWTLPVAECSDTQCSGTITSSSGNTFPFTWDGRRLAVTREDDVTRNKKEACIDTETGAVMPIAESAARITWHYHYGQFVGTPDRLVGSSVTRTTYEFFGTCEPSPDDQVKATYEWRLTPVETS